MGRKKITVEPFNKELGEWVTLSETESALGYNQRTIRRLANEKGIKTKLGLVKNRPQLLYFIKKIDK